MTEGKVKLGIPYKGTTIGVEVPEKVAVLGIKVSSKLLIGLGLGILVLVAGIIYYTTKGKNVAQQTTENSKSLQA